MQRGTSFIERRQSPNDQASAGVPSFEITTAGQVQRVMTTEEANAYLRKAKGFLEKRRTSGIDSPPYIQRGPRCAVLYRVSDLDAWENAQIRTSTSDHVGCGTG